MQEQIVTPKERAEIAESFGIDDQYLYQCLTGRKEMKPPLAFDIEEHTQRRVRRWHLRRKTWHRYWPELTHDPDAPPIPRPDAANDDIAQGDLGQRRAA